MPDGFGTKRPAVLPNPAVVVYQGGALRRRWPGVSGGLCLGGPPAARRAAGWRGSRSYRLTSRGGELTATIFLGAWSRSLVEGAERSRWSPGTPITVFARALGPFDPTCGIVGLVQTTEPISSASLEPSICDEARRFLVR
jgi:hypothetical protein